MKQNIEKYVDIGGRERKKKNIYRITVCKVYELSHKRQWNTALRLIHPNPSIIRNILVIVSFGAYWSRIITIESFKQYSFIHFFYSIRRWEALKWN